MENLQQKYDADKPATETEGPHDSLLPLDRAKEQHENLLPQDGASEHSPPDGTRELLPHDGAGEDDKGHMDSNKDQDESVFDEIEAPNGGWGWMCVLGCMLMHMFLGGLTRTYGLIYIQLIKRFNSSAGLTAWVGGVGTALRMGGSPLGSGLANRFSARRVAFIGGIFLGLAVILSAFTPNTEFMFFSYSLLGGLGGTLMYTPGIVVVGQYFTTKRSIAIGISTAGSGIGAFVFPPLMEWLFHYYGYLGTMLIMGALMFNPCISGMLYRPLKRKKSNKHRGETIKLKPSDSVEDGKLKQLHSTTLKEDLYGSNISIEDQIVEYSHEMDNEKHECRSKSRGEHPLEAVESNPSSQGVKTRPSSKNIRNKPLESVKHKFGSCWSSILRYTDFSLLSYPQFSLFVIALSLQTMSYVGAQMLLPAHAITSGATQRQGAFLLSILGIADLVGRFSAGFIFSISFIRTRRFIAYNLAIFTVAITFFLFAIFTSFMSLVVITAIHGVINGCVVSQRAVAVSDLMGVAKLSSTFGLTVFGQGVALLVGPAFSGFLRDLTGSYSFSMAFCGITSSMAALTYFSIPFVIKFRERKNRNQTERA